MAWMQSEADQARTRDLQALEIKRADFARRLLKRGLLFEQALFVQQGGGFSGIAVFHDTLYLITGPAPADTDSDFTCRHLPNPNCKFLPFVIDGEGMMGVFGMGKKGGVGYKLQIDQNDGEPIVQEYLPALNSILEMPKGAHCALFNAVCRNKPDNFVWSFRSIETATMEDIAIRWTKRFATLR